MEKHVVRRAPLVWWAGGLLLGLTQLLAIAVRKPLGVSTQFVVADAMVLERVAPAYVRGHPLIDKAKYLDPGYSWWLDIGLVLGAFLAALFVRRWRLRFLPVWSRINGHGYVRRFLFGLLGGFLILLGARFAHGCTSGQFASGWAQLSVSVIPFTVMMFAMGLLTARLAYPKVPEIQQEVQE
jgi:hypothetical protein